MEKWCMNSTSRKHRGREREGEGERDKVILLYYNAKQSNPKLSTETEKKSITFVPLLDGVLSSGDWMLQRMLMNPVVVQL